ncbi:hypothetical protein NQ317_009138 [Molorchus minor]|uniref:Uncharacterized protein n=1 Tax=Molorchus minor TaxID=1323400 RepID=A0ABQ9JZE0_9CUCU|nr:hypothetical protein NQ317_009138 [Molorchus minor]
MALKSTCLPTRVFHKCQCLNAKYVNIIPNAKTFLNTTRWSTGIFQEYKCLNVNLCCGKPQGNDYDWTCGDILEAQKLTGLNHHGLCYLWIVCGLSDYLRQVCNNL